MEESQATECCCFRLAPAPTHGRSVWDEERDVILAAWMVIRQKFKLHNAWVDCCTYTGSMLTYSHADPEA
jgi:hypothetical protein